MKFEIIVHTACYDKSGIAEHKYNVSVDADDFGDAARYAQKGFCNILKMDIYPKG